jgi:hypothetical protein
MGLLDDAIHEHLELKRRHGRDRVLAARQERRARRSVRRDQPASEELWEVANAEVAVYDRRPRDDRAHAEHAHRGSSAPLDQETAEVDMQTVLGEGDEGIAPVEPLAVEPITASSAAERASRRGDSAEDWLQSEVEPDATRAAGGTRASTEEAARDDRRLVW